MKIIFLVQLLNVTCLNLNYLVSSENPAQDEVIFAKNVIKTAKISSKNSIYSKAVSDSKSLLNDQHNLDSNLHRVRNENTSRIIFGQISINTVRNKFDWYMKIKKNETDFLRSQKEKLTIVF